MRWHVEEYLSAHRGKERDIENETMRSMFYSATLESPYEMENSPTYLYIHMNLQLSYVDFDLAAIIN